MFATNYVYRVNNRDRAYNAYIWVDVYVTYFISTLLLSVCSVEFSCTKVLNNTPHTTVLYLI